MQNVFARKLFHFCRTTWTRNNFNFIELAPNCLLTKYVAIVVDSVFENDNCRNLNKKLKNYTVPVREEKLNWGNQPM